MVKAAKGPFLTSCDIGNSKVEKPGPRFISHEARSLLYSLTV